MNVISKSGTTTETSVAFRLLKQFMEQKLPNRHNHCPYRFYSSTLHDKQLPVLDNPLLIPLKMRERIVATTDKARGTLKALADTKGYETFVIPDDIGGRFSLISLLDKLTQGM